MIYLEYQGHLTPDQARDLADYLCAMADDDEGATRHGAAR
jgi:hypothetical protein